MKLVDVIKTKNGLAYLDKHPNTIIDTPAKLNLEVRGYDKNVDYGESNFSYKDHVRKMRKTYENSFLYMVNEVYNKSGTPSFKGMAQILYNRIINFDGDFLMWHPTKAEVSYMPYNKVQLTDDSTYEYLKKGRQQISIFKFIAKVFKDDKSYTEQDKKDFCEYINSFTMNGLTVEYLEGEDIGKSYAEVPHKGWASYSCMANNASYPATMFTIYNENCQLGIVKNGEEIVGRFLRWKTTDGEWYEDRLYYKTYAVQSWYNERCEKEGVVKYGGKRVTVDLKRAFDSYSSKEKPGYLDSLTNVSKDKKQLSNKYDTFK